MTAIRKAIIALAAGAALIGAAAPALAESQPSQGIASTGRNDAGFGGGPHCHVQVVAGRQQDQFDQIVVYPSHRGHEASGLPATIFQADPNCDGIPG
jgi:hypothetical protein